MSKIFINVWWSNEDNKHLDIYYMALLPVSGLPDGIPLELFRLCLLDCMGVDGCFFFGMLPDVDTGRLVLSLKVNLIF